MQVVFVNRFFHPDHSATSQMLTDLAVHLADRGWNVTVVTSRQLYEDSRARLPAHERFAGVNIHRVWTSRFGRSSLPLRAIDYATFYAGAFLALRGHGQAVVVALTDPPLLSIVARLASPRLVNWVQDLFPDVARILGVPVPGVVDRLRDWSLRKARLNVAIGASMAARIAGPTVVQHNWAGADLTASPRDMTRPFTVAYSGNLGRAHEIDTMLGAMRNLPHIRFVVTGGGALMPALQNQAPANVEFRAYAARAQLGESLSDADVHLVSLRPELEGTIVPSKFYGILAVGRPVIFIGARDSEMGRTITENGCGFAIEPGQSSELTQVIEGLAADRQRAARMGQRGREIYERQFAPEIALANWERILTSVVNE